VIKCTIQTNTYKLSDLLEKIVQYKFTNISPLQCLPNITPLKKENKESIRVIFYADGNINSLISMCTEEWVNKIGGNGIGIGHIMD